MDEEDRLEEIIDFEETPSLIWDIVFFLVFFIFFMFPYISFGSEINGQPLALKISDQATVSGDVVRLGDIAVIEGTGAIPEEIAGLVVTPSPRPGRSKNIIRSRITALFKDSFKEEDNISVDAPDVIVVTRSFQKISEDDLRGLFENRVKELSGTEISKISDFRIRGKNLFGSGMLDIKPVYDNQGIRMGRLSIPVDVYVSGKKEGRLTLSAKVGVFSKVACAARDIPKNSVLTEDDIRIESREIRTGVSGGILSDISNALGKKTKSGIRAGAVIPEKLLESPSVLKKGDRVRLVAKSGLLRVETVAEASSDAAKGESVLVKNLDSGRMITARVVDSDTVEVLF